LKYDFGFDSFNLKDFYATEARLTFAMIGYNLMSLFRTFLLQEKTQKTLSTKKDGHGLADSGTIQKSSSTLLFSLMRNLG